MGKFLKWLFVIDDKKKDDKKCKVCKTDLKEGMKFCSNCGMPANGKTAYPMKPPAMPIYVQPPPVKKGGGESGQASNKKKMNPGVFFAIIIVAVIFAMVVFSDKNKESNPETIIASEQQVVQEEKVLPISQVSNEAVITKSDTGSFYYGDDRIEYKYEEVQIGGYK